MTRRSVFILILFVFIPLSALSSWVSFHLASKQPEQLNYNPPVIMSHVEVSGVWRDENSDIHVALKIFRSKNRHCRLTSVREVYPAEGGKPLKVFAATHQGGNKDQNPIPYEYNVGNLDPGKYLLIVVLHYHCADQTYIIPQPTARFEVQQ